MFGYLLETVDPRGVPRAIMGTGITSDLSMSTQGSRHPKTIVLTHKMHHGLIGVRAAVMELGLRGSLIPTVRTAVGFLKPLLNAMIAEDMFALGKSKGCFVHPLGVFDAELVVTYYAAFIMSVA